MKASSPQAKLTTEQEFERAVAMCRDVFQKKLHDYSASWRILRLASLVDQLFIKAKRIRRLEEGDGQLVADSRSSEFIGLVNYSAIGLIQLSRGVLDPTQELDLTPQQALACYDSETQQALALMLRKNHDYGEAWRGMQVSSYTDLILVKLLRMRQITALGGHTLASEGLDANLLDIINYSVFALIRLEIEKAP